MIKPITFEEQIVGSKNDGGIYRNLYPRDGILWGCGMTVTSTQIEIASGMFVIGGRMIHVDGKTVFDVEEPIANGYARLKTIIDLNQPTTQAECGQFRTKIEFSTTTLFPELTQEDVNNTGKVYEQELAVVKIEAGNITGITRKLEKIGTDAEKLGGKEPGYYATKTAVATAQGTANAAIPKKGGTITGHLSPATANNIRLGITSLPWEYVVAREVYAHGGQLISRNPSNPAGDYILMDFNSHQIRNGHATDAAKICSNGVVWVRNFSNSGWNAINASAFTQQSSVRFKDVLGDMTRERACKVLDLELIKYRYKAEYDDNPKTHYGIKAEQADEMELWDIVEYSIHDGQPEAIDYSKLTPYLIGIAKDHDERVKQLEAKVKKAEWENTEMKEEMVELKKWVEALEATKK